jgi:UDPglucose 6-dehydrogenase
LIVGGPQIMCDLVVSAFSSLPSVELNYYRTTALSAELCKYMENCFLATKVAFVNQFYDIAMALGVEFDELRRLWLLDPRVGVSHSAVTAERGFRGRCLPKDVAALVWLMAEHGGASLLEAVLDYNVRVCQLKDGEGRASAVGPARML